MLADRTAADIIALIGDELATVRGIRAALAGKTGTGYDLARAHCDGRVEVFEMLLQRIGCEFGAIVELDDAFALGVFD